MRDARLPWFSAFSCLGSLHFLFWVNIACRESRKTFDDVHEILVSAKRKAVVALDGLYSSFCNECKQQTSNIISYMHAVLVLERHQSSPYMSLTYCSRSTLFPLFIHLFGVCLPIAYFISSLPSAEILILKFICKIQSDQSGL